MNKNKHLLLWSSLGVTCLLLAAAAQENLFREWRGIQGKIAADEDRFDIRIRQVVAPQTGKVDRCVTCHVGMDSGERLTAAQPMARPHPPVVHDPADFGCTTCHGGVKQAGEVSFIYREEALGKGESGKPVIVPGDPAASEMIRRIKSDDPDEKMPPPEEHPHPLEQDQIALLETIAPQAAARWSWRSRMIRPSSRRARRGRPSSHSGRT